VRSSALSLEGHSVIDRESRTKLSELIKHLAVGQITNDEFEDRLLLLGFADPAVWEVFSSSAWCLYSDLREYRLSGKYRLPKAARRDVARWILFLKTDLEYEWPRLGRFRSLVLLLTNVFSLGLVGITYRKYFRRFGDLDVWPFLRRSDYDLALKQPPYFTGAL
jgi:hypothetical protein